MRNVLLILTHRYSFASHLPFTKKYNELILKTGLKVIYVNNPQDIMPNINKYKNELYGIAIYEQRIYDTYLYDNNLHIIDVFNLLQDLKKQGVKIFPDLDDQYFYDTKKYYKKMQHHHKELNMPNSKAIVFKKFNPDDYQLYIDKVFKKVYRLFKKGIFKIIIKKGFTYEQLGVVLLELNDNDNMEEIKNKLIKKLDRLEYIEDWKTNKMIPITELERGIDRVIIVQPYNEIVADRTKEYRCFFINGEFVNFFAFGAKWTKEGFIRYPNKCYEIDNKIHEHVFQMAKKTFDNFIMKYAKTKPPIIRIDISYMEKDYDDAIMIDNKYYRFYVNEIEIQPTFYVNLPLICKGVNMSTIKYQDKLAHALVNNISGSTNWQ